MAIVVNIARRHDASCLAKTTGAAEGPVITGQGGVTTCERQRKAASPP